MKKQHPKMALLSKWALQISKALPNPQQNVLLKGFHFLQSLLQLRSQEPINVFMLTVALVIRQGGTSENRQKNQLPNGEETGQSRKVTTLSL